MIEFKIPKQANTVEDVLNEIDKYGEAVAQGVLGIAEFYKEKAEKCGCRQCRQLYYRKLDELLEQGYYILENEEGHLEIYQLDFPDD